MDGFGGGTIFLEHSMLELFGRVVVEGGVERLRVNLVQQFTEFWNVSTGLCILWPLISFRDGQEPDDNSSENAWP